MVYIQQLSEKKRKGQEDQNQAQVKAQQDRQRLRQKVLRLCQDLKPQRTWRIAGDETPGANVDDSKLPLIHGSKIRSDDRPAGSAQGPAGARSRSVGRERLAVTLDPQLRRSSGSALSPYLQTLTGTKQPVIAGGGVGLAAEPSTLQVLYPTRRQAARADFVSGAVCTLDGEGMHPTRTRGIVG